MRGHAQFRRGNVCQRVSVAVNRGTEVLAELGQQVQQQRALVWRAVVQRCTERLQLAVVVHKLLRDLGTQFGQDTLNVRNENLHTNGSQKKPRGRISAPCSSGG